MRGGNWKFQQPRQCLVRRYRWHGGTRCRKDDRKSKFACILEAIESTRMRMEGFLPFIHEDHIAGRGDNSLQHYNLVHKFIPMHQAMKIHAAEAAVDKEWEKLEKISAFDEARASGATVHFASLMDICHLKMPNWRQSNKNTKVELYSEAIL